MIRFSCVLTTILMLGCAQGSEAPDPEVLNPPVNSPPRRDAPEQTPPEKSETPSSCVLVKTVWGGNCKVDFFKCPDGTWHLDSKCYPPDWVFPWENLPDPPPDLKPIHQPTE